jgi:hypothetical protein
MSSPSSEAKDVDPALLYAPQWARDRALMPTANSAADRALAPSDNSAADRALMPSANSAADRALAAPIQWPPRGRRLDNVHLFGDDRAVLEARRELALQPDKVPEPPQPDPSDQIVGKTVLRICGVAGAAAVVAWTLVSALDARSPKHEPARGAATTAVPVAAVVPNTQDSAPAVTTARLDGNSPGSGSDEAGQEPRKEAILGVPAAVAASPAAAEAAPAIALDQAKAEPTPSGLITRQVDRDELAFLVRRGESFISSGDLAAARLMLQRAAEAGDVHAALALASTYDPNTIQKLGIQGLAADEAMARLWYERAAQFGSPEAPRRLQQLATQTNSLP